MSFSSLMSINSINKNLNEEMNTETINDSREEEEEEDPSSSVILTNKDNVEKEFDVPITSSKIVASHLQPLVRNVISTVDLGCKLDLKRICLQVRNAEYNPKRFNAVIMRIRKPRTTSLIFSSGKMVCTGAQSEEDSFEAARRYARVMQKLSFPVKFHNFKIENMVGTIDLKYPLRFDRIEKIARDHHQFCNYEPEIFPGLIYRMIQPKVVLLIFVSGKIVLAGAKVRREMHEAFQRIHPILKQCRK